MDPSLKKYIATGVRYLVPLAVSVGLVIWLFKKVDFHEVWRTIHDGCDFFWIAVMMALTVISEAIRGCRWGMQMRAAGVPRMPIVAQWVSIWGAYAMNLLFPNLGEAWRCVYVGKRENVKLSTVIGTDIGDRLSDLVIIVALMILCLFVAHTEIMDFMRTYVVGRDLLEITDSPWLWISAVVVLAAFWLICHYLKLLLSAKL